MARLPKQEGSKCGAYATAYYSYFKDGKADILKAVDNIFNVVKFSVGEGSDPRKIKSYLGEGAEIYIPEDILDSNLRQLANNLIQDRQIYSNSLKDLIGENNYAITLWYPENLFDNGANMMDQLPALHYMVARVTTNGLEVIDSNAPYDNNNKENWIKVDVSSDPYRVNGMKFTGLVIKK